MTDKCETCGITAEQLSQPWGALIVNSIRIGRRLVQWVNCLSCERQENMHSRVANQDESR